MSINQIPEGWKETTLGEVADVLGGGTPKTTIEKYWNGKIPWISVVDFNNDNRWIAETEKKISEKGLECSSTQLLNAGDIIISARGTVGKFAQLKKPMSFNQSCYGLRAKPNTDKDFLFYLLKSCIHVIKKTVHGAVFDTITRNTFSNIYINLPPLPEQKAIADVLSSFDNKIELLREQNKTLEAIAQTIFNEWFVRFNFPDENGKPYQASGGKMIDSELGPIPEDWRVGNLGDFILHNSELIKPSDNPDILYSLYSIPSFDNNKIYEKTYGDKILSCKYLLPLNCFLVSKLNPKTPRIWQIIDAKKNSICSTEFQVITTKNSCFYSLVYSVLTSKNFTLVFASKAKGTSSSHQRSNQQDIIQHKMALPTNQVIERYNSFLMPFLLKIEINNSQIQTLSNLRDELLPKLMNGEIRVEEANK